MESPARRRPPAVENWLSGRKIGKLPGGTVESSLQSRFLLEGGVSALISRCVVLVGGSAERSLSRVESTKGRRVDDWLARIASLDGGSVSASEDPGEDKNRGRDFRGWLGTCKVFAKMRVEGDLCFEEPMVLLRD